MRRVVSVWCPWWASDRRARLEGPASPFAAPDKPAATAAAQGGAVALVTVNPAAAAAGLAPGLALASARALVPGLAVARDDPDDRARGLRALARWATRWSPHVALDAHDPDREGASGGGAPGGLLLDITGGAHLFGGEAGLLADLRVRLRAAGVRDPGLAAADTPALAWAGARFHPEAATPSGLVIAAQDGAEVLDALPVEALRVPPDTARQARLLGLTCVADLRAQPRAALARRFPGALLRRLDQALGRCGESVSPLVHARPARAEIRFPEPVSDQAMVVEAAARAARALAADLEARGCGARGFRLILRRVDGRTATVAIEACAAVRDGAHIARLTALRLERAALDPGFGLDAVCLEARRLEPLGARQPALEDAIAPDAGAAAAAALADRLAARLGPEAVRRARVQAGWRPDRVWRWVRADAAPVLKTDTPGEAGPAPLVRLDPPEPAQAMAVAPDGPPLQVRWRRRIHRIARAEGPRRLEPEWWRADAWARRRDYFLVETGAGARLQLAREGGYGDAEPPRWFVCGAG